MAKIQNGHHFWGGENFLKIAKSTFLRYPVGRKFRRNRSISHGLGDMSTFAFFSVQNDANLYPLERQLTKASEPTFDLEGGAKGQI